MVIADEAGSTLTPKGIATRQRIIDAACELVFERGAAAVSLDDVLAATGTSKSQLYHYFTDRPGLIRAIVTRQGERVLGLHSSVLGSVDRWEALYRWRDFVVAAVRETDCRGGCPVGSLASELAELDEQSRLGLASVFARWGDMIAAALRAMAANGQLDPDADVSRLALATLASLQGGLLLAKTSRSVVPLEIALDAAIAHLRASASGPSSTSASSSPASASGPADTGNRSQRGHRFRQRSQLRHRQHDYAERDASVLPHGHPAIRRRREFDWPGRLIAVVVVALAVALGNFAVATTFGLAGGSRRMQLEVGLVFGLFEGGMPLIGLLLGSQLSNVLGNTARPVGAALLGATGLYGLVADLLPKRPARDRTWRVRLWLMAVALSLDNLVVGLALGTYHVPLLFALITFAAAGAGLSLLGVEVGRRAGALLARRSGSDSVGATGERVASILLIGLGVVLGLGVLG